MKRPHASPSRSEPVRHEESEVVITDAEVDRIREILLGIQARLGAEATAKLAAPAGSRRADDERS